MPNHLPLPLVQLHNKKRWTNKSVMAKIARAAVLRITSNRKLEQWDIYLVRRVKVECAFSRNWPKSTHPGNKNANSREVTKAEFELKPNVWCIELALGNAHGMSNKIVLISRWQQHREFKFSSVSIHIFPTVFLDYIQVVSSSCKEQTKDAEVKP